MLAVLADPAWRELAREEAPRFVAARFGLERMIEETLDLYDLSPDLPVGTGSAPDGAQG